VGPMKPGIKISSRVKWLEREADHSSLSIDEKNAWSHTSTIPTSSCVGH